MAAAVRRLAVRGHIGLLRVSLLGVERRERLLERWALWLLTGVLAFLKRPLPDLGEIESLGRWRLGLAAPENLTVIRGRLELLILLHWCSGLRVCVGASHAGKEIESAHMSALKVVAGRTHDATGNRTNGRPDARNDAAESRARCCTA